MDERFFTTFVLQLQVQRLYTLASEPPDGQDPQHTYLCNSYSTHSVVLAQEAEAGICLPILYETKALSYSGVPLHVTLNVSSVNRASFHKRHEAYRQVWQPDFLLTHWGLLKLGFWEFLNPFQAQLVRDQGKPSAKSQEGDGATGKDPLH